MANYTPGSKRSRRGRSALPWILVAFLPATAALWHSLLSKGDFAESPFFWAFQITVPLISSWFIMRPYARRNWIHYLSVPLLTLGFVFVNVCAVVISECTLHPMRL